MTYTDEYNAQLAALLVAVTAVTDVGRVHDRPRHGDFRERWVVELNGITEIRSWEIAPEQTDVVRREQGRRHRYRTWAIRGVIGLSDIALEDEPENPPADEATDASFHVAQRLAGEIADSIDAARESHVAAGTFIDHEPVQIGEPQVVTIGGGALCWGVTLTLTGYTVITP